MTINRLKEMSNEKIGTLRTKKDKISFLRNKMLVKNMEFLNTL